MVNSRSKLVEKFEMGSIVFTHGSSQGYHSLAKFGISSLCLAGEFPFSFPSRHQIFMDSRLDAILCFIGIETIVKNRVQYRFPQPPFLFINIEMMTCRDVYRLSFSIGNSSMKSFDVWFVSTSWLYAYRVETSLAMGKVSTAVASEPQSTEDRRNIFMILIIEIEAETMRRREKAHFSSGLLYSTNPFKQKLDTDAPHCFCYDFVLHPHGTTFTYKIELRHDCISSSSFGGITFHAFPRTEEKSKGNRNEKQKSIDMGGTKFEIQLHSCYFKIPEWKKTISRMGKTIQEKTKKTISINNVHKNRKKSHKEKGEKII